MSKPLENCLVSEHKLGGGKHKLGVALWTTLSKHYEEVIICIDNQTNAELAGMTYIYVERWASSRQTCTQKSC